MAQAKATPQAQNRLQEIFSSRYAVFYVLVLPAFLLRMIYTVIPIIQTVLISFTDRTILGGRYIGLRNYEILVRDSTLIGSLGWTLLYTGTSAIAETVVGLGIAILLMQNLRLRWLSNFIMLLPWVVAPMLAAVAFQILYFEDGGILNEILRQLGFGNAAVRWLSDAETARVSTILMTVWKNVSWVALIFMAAAIGSLSKEVLEAAAVDGANTLQRFWYVMLPLLKPAIYLVLLLRAMAEVQTFEQIYGLTRGGPGSATKTLALYAFERFFQQLRYGYGSAVNMVLLVMTIAIGAIFAWLLYRSREI